VEPLALAGRETTAGIHVGAPAVDVGRPPARLAPRHALRLAVLVALAALAISAPIWQLQGSNPFDTNLKADYLRARALRDGLDSFAPIDSLADRYFPERGVPFRDPSPHPPVVALLVEPATLLTFPQFCAVWVLLNLALLLFVGRWLRLSPLVTLALAAWPPLFLTLKSFQWELVLLTLVAAGWRDAHQGHDRRAGFWLGLAGVIKLYPAFLLLPFLLQRRFRLVGAAALTLALGQAGSLAAVGPGGLWRYYTDLLPHLGAVSYAGSIVDTSVHGTLLRLLPGAPGLVLALTAVASLLALTSLARLRLEAGPVAVLLLLPTYVLSVYLVLALPLVVALWREGRLRALIIPATIAASFPYYVVNGLVRLPSLPALFGVIEPLGYAGILAAAVFLDDQVRREY
jgi:hypothetical protein